MKWRKTLEVLCYNNILVNLKKIWKTGNDVCYRILNGKQKDRIKYENSRDMNI